MRPTVRPALVLRAPLPRAVLAAVLGAAVLLTASPAGAGVTGLPAAPAPASAASAAEAVAPEPPPSVEGAETAPPAGPVPTWFTARAQEVAAAAVPEPPVPMRTAPEAPSAYFGQVSCDPVEKPGTQRLRSLLRASFGKANAGGITRACSVGGTSEHKEGRAYDWALDANNPADRALADGFIAWATGLDGAGVPQGNASRLGIQYIIWDRQIWNARSGWKPYTGASPHTDHVHVSLSWDGAFARTSWWTGTAVTQVDHGPCQVFVGELAAPWSAPNYTRCADPVRRSVVPAGSLDELRPVPGGVVVRGWSRDPDTSAPVVVHTYVDGAPAAVSKAQLGRQDVGPHGFELTVPLPAGQHRVCVYAIDVGVGGSNPLLGCGTTTKLSNPFGSHDRVDLVVGGHRTSGWAIDPDTSAPVQTHVYVDGRLAAQPTASVVRPDVAAAYPGRGDAHGFSAGLSLSRGAHDVCVYAINVGEGDANPLLGCRRVSSPGQSPFGSLDSVRTSAEGVSVSGWAIDPDTTTPSAVHVYVDGQLRLVAPSAAPRDDVARAYPGFGSGHGFAATVGGVGPGTHQVCVYAINQLAGTDNSLLSCGSVQVG